MAFSLNRVQLIGNVGQDPIVGETSGGKKFANFSLATTESWRNKNTNEYDKHTDWHRVVCYNEALSRIIEMRVIKGSKLFIEGQLKTRKYKDREGQEKIITEVVMQNFSSNLIILDGKDDRSGGGSFASNSTDATVDTTPDFDDEMPF